jgi:hypothetical protein
MTNSTRLGSLLASVTIAALLHGCAQPTSDSAKLAAIKSEALTLARTHPVIAGRGWTTIRQGEWPPAIASLDPKVVTIDRRGLDIVVKHGLDGGWGYEIPLHGRSLRMPAACYSEPGHGVFWHGPC